MKEDYRGWLFSLTNKKAAAIAVYNFYDPKQQLLAGFLDFLEQDSPFTILQQTLLIESEKRKKHYQLLFNPTDIYNMENYPAIFALVCCPEMDITGWIVCQPKKYIETGEWKVLYQPPEE